MPGWQRAGYDPRVDPRFDPRFEQREGDLHDSEYDDYPPRDLPTFVPPPVDPGYLRYPQNRPMPYHPYQRLAPEDELRMLEEEEKMIEDELNEIKKRIEKLKKEKEVKFGRSDRPDGLWTHDR